MTAVRPLESPFARLNLTRNPFGEPARDDWAGLVVDDRVDAASLCACLRGSRFAVQLRGPSGRGKSTLLRWLHDRVGGRVPYTYLPPDAPPPMIPPAPIVFVDEVQRLGWLARRRLWRRDATFAIATHGDHTRELERAGCEVVTIEVGGMDRPRLEQILARRLEWARRGPGPVPRVTPDGIDRLLERFGDNLRAMERYLYEVYQRLEDNADVEV